MLFQLLQTSGVCAGFLAVIWLIGRLGGRRIAPGCMNALWLIALVRLFLPLDLPSRLSAYRLLGPAAQPAYLENALSRSAALAASPLSLPNVLAGVWAAGLICCAFHLAQSYRHLHTLCRAAAPVSAPAVCRIIRHAGLRRTVQVRAHSAVSVPCTFGVQYEVMDITSPRVYRFIEDVLDEIIELFPSPIIHIGGDEVKFDQWKASPRVQAYMKEHGIDTPADLQVLFTNDISYMLNRKGRRMMGWNDITGNKIHEYNDADDATARQKLAEGTIVQFWKGDLDLIEKTARQGYDIVNSYHYMTYLDYDYKQIPLRQAYDFSPIPEGLPKELEKRILGLGCQMWGEETLSDEWMYSRIFPRSAAYAEVGWTLPQRKDYASFLRSLEGLKAIWKEKGYTVGGE